MSDGLDPINAKTPLGKRLLELREKFVAGGGVLLSQEEIDCLRRGCADCELRRRLRTADELLMGAWMYGAITTVKRRGKGHTVKMWGGCNSAIEDIQTYLTRYGHLSLDGLPTENHDGFRKQLVDHYEWLNQRLPEVNHGD